MLPIASTLQRAKSRKSTTIGPERLSPKQDGTVPGLGMSSLVVLLRGITAWHRLTMHLSPTWTRHLFAGFAVRLIVLPQVVALNGICLMHVAKRFVLVERVRALTMAAAESRALDMCYQMFTTMW